MKDNIKRFSLRLPEEMHAAMVEIATEDRRSLNDEMLIALEQFIAAHRAKRSSDPPAA